MAHLTTKRRHGWTIGIVLGSLLASAFGPPETASELPSRSDAHTRRDPAPEEEHVFLIVFENKDYDEIIGQSEAPYFNELANQYGLATNFHGITHPSLPNYFALVAGSTLGITDNCDSCSVRGRHVGDQLEARGLDWRAYLESMPKPCYKGSDTGKYVKHHNPFAYFRSLRTDPARCVDHVVPLSTLSEDVASDHVRNLSVIIPNRCNDMHDCSVSTGDAWLRRILRPIMGSTSFTSGGVVFVTFDEDGTGNHVPTIVVSPRTETGVRSSRRFNHYSLLRTIETLFALPYLRQAAARRHGDLTRAFL